MTDVRVTDMSGECRSGGHKRCDAGLRHATGYHWWCICPCHPDPPRTGDNPGFPEAHAQWTWARAGLERP